MLKLVLFNQFMDVFFIHLLDTYLKQVQILLSDHRFDDRHVFITCSNCFTGYGTNTMNAVNFFETKVVEKLEVIRKSIGFREEISAFKRCRLETIFSHIYNRLLRLAVRFMDYYELQYNKNKLRIE